MGNTSATKRNPCWTQTTLLVSNNCDHCCHHHLHQRYQVSIHQFNLDVVIISLNKILSSDISWLPSHSDLDAQTLHHGHYNLQDLSILEVDLRVLELDLRFRGGLGLSPPLKFSSPIGLRPSPPLNLKSNSKIPKSHCKPSDFGFFCWSWAPKSIIGAGDLDAGGVLKLNFSLIVAHSCSPAQTPVQRPHLGK